MTTKKILLILTLTCLSTAALAQKTAAEATAEYQAMLADGNPADLFEAKGEDLWKQARGPQKQTLQKCDLGKGPGVAKGAFVELPRYFADTQRVQDLESRLHTCMETQQGFSAAEIAKSERNNVIALAAWVSGQSKGMKFNVPQDHMEEKIMYEVGKRVFFTRAGTHDFSCASCHQADGKRIRLQDLPNITTNAGAGAAAAGWPAYRHTPGQMWTMQTRINDCFRQMRFPFPILASDATIALTSYMGVTGKGAVSITPALKR